MRMNLFGACLLAIAVLAPQAWAMDRLDYNRDVRPILSSNCFGCHGPDDGHRAGGLRLDTEAGARATLESGVVAIVPGKPLESELIHRLTTDEKSERMPPAKSGKKPLTPEQVEVLRRWVSEGAAYAGHWAYQKPVESAPPAVRDTAWPRNYVDGFVLSTLERRGLRPSPEADRLALLRRAALDLTGLPLTPERADAWSRDTSPDAYERAVDEMLASPAFGEHWARAWLDLARYADSTGYAEDNPREIWGYRDWVIRALNDNLPFDRFTLLQLAGDLQPNATTEQLIATAFHRNTQTNNEGGTDDEEFRNVAVVDRVNTTFAVWMGVSMACAQCHNHKYDPISQEEYFRAFAILNNTQDADRRDESPLVSFDSPDTASRRTQMTARITELERSLTQPTPAAIADMAKWEAGFPRDLAWRTPLPLAARAGQDGKAQGEVEVNPEGVVRARKADVESFSIDLPLTLSKLTAIRIETLPHNQPAAKPKAHAFTLGRVQAQVVNPDARPVTGRFVRVELPGKGQMLHLAEVEAFSAGVNLAPKGSASQSSTDYEGAASRANDGNTRGDYTAGSVNHTAQQDDPWWEVDLGRAAPIDSIRVWNRLDGLTQRLDGYVVTVLDEARARVWTSGPQARAPEVSQAFTLGGAQPVAFTRALASSVKPGTQPDSVIAAGNKPGVWTPQDPTKPAMLTLLTQDLTLAKGAVLRLTLSRGQGGPLPALRVSLSESPAVVAWSQTPTDIASLLARAPDERTQADRDRLTQHYLQEVSPQLAGERKELASLRKQLSDLKSATVPVMREMPTDRRRTTQVHVRGNFLEKGAKVTEGVPASLHPPGAAQPTDRLGLAQWIVSPNNPLTARVAVNRFWEKVFGTGLVATSEEFGSQGEAPSHPELLDTLAVRFMREGWDVKKLLRTLVTSATYRQSARVDAGSLAADPENRWLARGPRVRITAEVVRDQSLFVAGLLSAKMYGPPVRPPQPGFGLNAAFGGGLDWNTSDGEDRYRRGIYTTWRRSNPYPSMATFDAPNREVCTVRRPRTNTPLQALVTMNDPVYVEAAQALARRMVREAGPEPEAIARRGLRLGLMRPPSDSELARLTSLHRRAKAGFALDRAAAKAMATDPLGPLPAGADETDLAAWTVVASVILNLDEMFMTR